MDQDIEYFNDVKSLIENKPIPNSNELVATLLAIKDLIDSNQIEEAEELLIKLIEENSQENI